MSIAYIEIEKDPKHPELDEVCPHDGSDLLVSEYGGHYICKENHHGLTVFDIMSRKTYNEIHGCTQTVIEK